MKNLSKLLLAFLLGFFLLGSYGISLAGYKARVWNPNKRESYPAKLTSEGVTIAAEPLYTDALAARIFDKKDIVSRGIMPVAIIIFNDNDYPIEVDGISIELIHKDEHLRSLAPTDVVNLLFGKEKPGLNRSILKSSNQDALDDFGSKFLMDKVIAPHEKGGGFVYIKIYDPKNLADYLSTSTIYIPKLYREEDSTPLIYFEIDLKAAVSAGITD